MEHRVRAVLHSGPVEQDCPDQASAADLFDRLRQIAPTIRIERLLGTRVVEVAGVS
ncbi:hypothetical protein [Brevundimonas nasdae]|uniref:Uncharacterized protein n=1 Tax=Brevundimonas nasdae TaxID=172043 RepID=A0ABX8THX3_9CAUL|nr:hypothetical protein [Brevundimonas nasdae]QYC10594.1 hypothetical protein KWG56_00780 [Brevundimonas nasdae]QYC13381.1 hypothetical protein KWG63_14335 [Brevundimonas nasdae]